MLVCVCVCVCVCVYVCVCLEERERGGCIFIKGKNITIAMAKLFVPWIHIIRNNYMGICIQ